MGRSRKRSPARSGADDGWSEAVSLDAGEVGVLTEVVPAPAAVCSPSPEPQAASSSRQTLAAAVRRPSATPSALLVAPGRDRRRAWAFALDHAGRGLWHIAPPPRRSPL